MLKWERSHFLAPVAMLPDGRIVSGSDETLRIWDVATGRTLATLQGHTASVKSLAVLPDGRVVSGSDDKTVRVWDVETGRALATVYGDAAFHSVACVDQRLIVAGDAIGNVWFIDLPKLPPA
jgi:WD40 repeat protein